jgi:hypothetical protein
MAFIYLTHLKGYSMTTIKDDYKKPIPPVEKCSICGGEIKPVALFDLDGWVLAGFDCKKFHDTIEVMDDFEWPFVEDTASWTDLEVAGFITV